MSWKLSMKEILEIWDKLPKKGLPVLEEELAKLLDLPEPEEKPDYSHLLDLSEPRQIWDDPVSRSMELNISRPSVKIPDNTKQMPENWVESTNRFINDWKI